MVKVWIIDDICLKSILGINEVESQGKGGTKTHPVAERRPITSWRVRLIKMYTLKHLRTICTEMNLKLKEEI